MKSIEDVALGRILSLGLAGPPVGGPAEVAQHLVCLQGQILGGALVSVALRTADRDHAEVAAAVTSGSLVRSWTQRGTIHMVAASDVRWILDLTAERVLHQARTRRAQLGIDEAMVESAAGIVTALIRDAGPISREVLLQALDPIGVGEVAGRGYHLITILAMRQVIVQGPLVGGGRTEQLFALMDDWVPSAPAKDRTDAVAEWMTRYAIGHGPVTAADAARWTGLPMSEVRAGLAAGLESGALATSQVEAATYLHAPDLPDRLAEHRDDARRMLLLPGFDELVLGYKDRTATLSPVGEKLVVPGGNGMFKNTVVTGGRAVGTWVRSGRAAVPTVAPFPGQRVSQRAVNAAAKDHPAFTGR